MRMSSRYTHTWCRPCSKVSMVRWKMASAKEMNEMKASDNATAPCVFDCQQGLRLFSHRWLQVIMGQVQLGEYLTFGKEVFNPG